MRITWNTDCNAPCIGRIVAEDGRDHLVQTDWDYPGVASSFGWSTRNVQKCPCCNELSSVFDDDNPEAVRCGECSECKVLAFQACGHNGTDGTVDCPECGVKASDFIAAAADWLSDNDGAEADDPGYFSEGE